MTSRQIFKCRFYAVEYRLPIVPIIKQFLNGNPRQLKRFLNTLYVRQELAKVAGFRDIRPDVLTKLMVLEYNSLYNSRFEELYRLQKTNEGVLPLGNVEQEAKLKWHSRPTMERQLVFRLSETMVKFRSVFKNINLQDYFGWHVMP